MDENQINPGHMVARNLLRVVGPLILATGLIFLIVGMVSFFSAFGGGGPPRFFWCGFVGLPLMFVGGVMTGSGYMGAVARYQAAEMAPVGKDTINYMADGVKPAIKDVTRAVVEGINEAQSNARCARCGMANDKDANFCKKCGQKMIA